MKTGYILTNEPFELNNNIVDVNKITSTISDILLKIENINLRNTCINELNAIYSDLKIKPAANKHHHNYIGGLIQHTAEVMQVAYSIARNFECNKDIIITATFYHDLMKTDEYTNEGDYLPYSSKIGHVVGSAYLFKQIALENNVSKEIIDEVVHCILAHHGRKEWGSPVEPQTVEAAIVHEADMISSRINPIYLQNNQSEMKDYYNKW